VDARPAQCCQGRTIRLAIVHSCYTSRAVQEIDGMKAINADQQNMFDFGIMLFGLR